MEEKKLPITCSICGRKNEFPIEQLKEGATLICPFCKLKLTLHGHMWTDIQKELDNVKKDS